MTDYNAIQQRVERQAQKTPDSGDDAVFVLCKIHNLLDEYDACHPAKTYAQDYFEKFPDAPRYHDDQPKPCITDVYCVSEHSGCDCKGTSCRACWNRPMKEAS
jgi:hypothetical protein